MSFELLRSAVTGMFIEGYKITGNPFSPASYPNQPFVEPTSERWIRFSIQTGTTIPASIGQTMSRTPGVLYIQIFIPTGQGSLPANQIADKIASFVNFAQLTPAIGHDITFELVSLSFTQDVDPWSEWLASCQFRYDVFQNFNLGIIHPATYTPNISNLIGGTLTDLDGIDITDWMDGSFALTNALDNSLAATGKRFRVYQLRSMQGIEAQDCPSLIISDSNDTKVFELLS